MSTKTTATSLTQNSDSPESPRQKIDFATALRQVHTRVMISCAVTLALGLGLGALADHYFQSSPRGLFVGVVVAAVVGECYLIYQGRQLKLKHKLTI